MSKNLIVIIGILLIWFLMIRKNDDAEQITNQTTTDNTVQTQSAESALKMSKLYTL